MSLHERLIELWKPDERISSMSTDGFGKGDDDDNECLTPQSLLSKQSNRRYAKSRTERLSDVVEHTEKLTPRPSASSMSGRPSEKKPLLNSSSNSSIGSASRHKLESLSARKAFPEVKAFGTQRPVPPSHVRGRVVDKFS